MRHPNDFAGSFVLQYHGIPEFEHRLSEKSGEGQSDPYPPVVSGRYRATQNQGVLPEDFW
jgi:hypothetical protein